MNARDEVINLSGLSPEWPVYGQFVAALDAYRADVRAETLAEVDEDLSTLRALEVAGVDNWSGYDNAMEILHSLD